MIRISFKTLLTNYGGLKNYNQNLFRYVRSIARRSNGPKLVEGKVKTVTRFDESERIESYEDFIHSMKKSNMGDELDVEKAFAEEDSFGHATERCEQVYDIHLKEEKGLKSAIKKEIIKRKYFKLDKETNLLTHAAKEQIHFLHKSNPLEWNCKAIAECFPVSEAGAKKLLKSNFTHTCPEKIKAHDEEVAERWKILKSQTFTTLIAPLTQKLYKEGKLVDDYFGGNPNLPTTPPSKKVIHLERKKHVGEFSAIVQTYANYEKEKLLASDKEKLLANDKENCLEKQLTLKGRRDVEINKKNNIKTIKKLKYAPEEFDDENVEVNSLRRKLHMNYADLPLSQFKEILKEEKKFKSSNEIEYDDILSDAPKEENSSRKTNDQQHVFLKISKYDKDQNINAMYDTNKYVKNVYKYDEKLGYQHPTGKVVKGNIQIPSKLYKKGRLYKVGQSVYDDSGEFLYKVPS